MRPTRCWRAGSWSPTTSPSGRAGARGAGSYDAGVATVLPLQQISLGRFDLALDGPLASEGRGCDPTPAPAVTAPTPGATLDRFPGTIEGTGEPGTTVVVTVGAQRFCVNEVDAAGRFACQTPFYAFVPPTGDVQVTARAYSSGRPSEPAIAGYTVAAEPPPAPSISDLESGVLAADASIGGTGRIGSVVTVTADGAPVCRAYVASGYWGCVPLPLPAGQVTLRAQQTSADGLTGPESDPVVVTVADSSPVEPPTITYPDRAGVLAPQGAFVLGTGRPGATVGVLVGLTPLCSATVGRDGSFACFYSQPVPTGDLTATQTVPGVGRSAPTSGLSVTSDFPTVTPGPGPSLPAPTSFDLNSFISLLVVLLVFLLGLR